MKRFFQAFSRGRTKSALNRLTDRQLHDIGLTRDKIDDHVDRLFS